eukprot:TRINITY_DN284_c0_g1_i1.p1 TRINITY_DN284_c0_g1~~TRINITY_DN284_c0_g1_i1.p1  ORF type:complete len:234 (-),score=37.51 TRINITY_DN284_c0_g1_i1:113-814(-)
MEKEDKSIDKKGQESSQNPKGGQDPKQSTDPKPGLSTEYYPWVLLASLHPETSFRLSLPPGSNLLSLPPDHTTVLQAFKHNYKQHHQQLLKGSADITLTVMYATSRSSFSTLAEFISHRGGMYQVTILDSDGSPRYGDHSIAKNWRNEWNSQMKALVSAEVKKQFTALEQKYTALEQKHTALLQQTDAQRKEWEEKWDSHKKCQEKWQLQRNRDKQERSILIEAIFKSLEALK